MRTLDIWSEFQPNSCCYLFAWKRSSCDIYCVCICSQVTQRACVCSRKGYNKVKSRIKCQERERRLWQAAGNCKVSNYIYICNFFLPTTFSLFRSCPSLSRIPFCACCAAALHCSSKSSVLQWKFYLLVLWNMWNNEKFKGKCNKFFFLPFHFFPN